jgi:hypothetical protein
MFAELLEFSWGNPKLMKTAGLVMRDAERGVNGHSEIIYSKITYILNNSFNLTEYLHGLIFANLDKYDVAIRGWIEKNRSKDWHWKWKSLLELPIFNKAEVIEPLKTTLMRGDYRALRKMEKIDKIASLVDFLNFGERSFTLWWQEFLKTPRYFTDSLEFGWRNPKLMGNAMLLMADAEQEVKGHRWFGGQGNSNFNLVRYLRCLILEDPGRYDAVIRGWVEENHSKDWHLKWKSFLELPILNRFEVIEPLRAILKEKDVNSFIGRICPALEMKRTNAINDITSLVKFLNYSTPSL